MTVASFRPAVFLVFALVALFAAACRPVSPPSSAGEGEGPTENRDRAESWEEGKAPEAVDSAQPGDVGSETSAPAPAPAEGEKPGHGAEESKGLPSGSVVLHLDETISHGSLVLRLLEVNDSRCPIGVRCVWEGQVAATVEVEKREGDRESAASPETVELVLRAGHETASAVAAGHELRLLGAEPHPRQGVTPERAARSVTLEIKPL